MEKGKVLIVDDERDFLNHIEDILIDVGYKVDVVASPLDAVRKIQEEHYHIVYTDLIMPYMNGVELCREVKTYSPETQVVLVTAYYKLLDAYLTDFERAGGCSHYLMKPFSSDELITITDKIFKELSTPSA